MQRYRGTGLCKVQWYKGKNVQRNRGTTVKRYGSQVHGTLVHRYTGIHSYTGTQVHRYTGTKVHRYKGTEVYGYTGTQVHRYRVTKV